MRKLLIGVLSGLSAIPLVFGVVLLTACSGGGYENGEEPSSIIDASQRFSVTAQQPSLEYSFTDGLFDFWYFYMGTIDYAPISSTTPRRFNGQTPITMSFSTTVVTEESISSSNSVAISNTTSLTRTSETIRGVRNSIGIEIGIKDLFSFGINTGYRYFRETHSSTQGNAQTFSLADTFTSATSWAQSVTETDTITIGAHGEAAGYYRFSLFTTKDVFIVVAYDKIRGEFIYEFQTFARPDYFFLDIEFNESANFAQRHCTNWMVFDDTLLEDLPAPEFDIGHTTALHDFSNRTDLNIGQISIPYITERAMFIGTDETFNMNIVIGPRNRDLTIILDDMKFVAPRGHHGISYFDNSSAQHTLTIELFGDNSITGGAGHDGVDATIPWQNIHTFTNAGSGFDAINARLNDITVIGAGSINLAGGKGGMSGKVSSSATVWPQDMRTNGLGTVGGIGGQAINANNISFVNATGSITVIGGQGGIGGNGSELMVRITFGSNSWFVADAFSGADGGRGGNAVLISGNITHPPLRPVSISGGQGGAGGNGITVSGISSANGSQGANGLRGVGLD